MHMHMEKKYTCGPEVCVIMDVCVLGEWYA